MSDLSSIFNACKDMASQSFEQQAIDMVTFENMMPLTELLLQDIEEEHILLLKSSLQILGFDVGPLDEKMNTETMRALESYFQTYPFEAVKLFNKIFANGFEIHRTGLEMPISTSNNIVSVDYEALDSYLQNESGNHAPETVFQAHDSIFHVFFYQYSKSCYSAYEKPLKDPAYKMDTNTPPLETPSERRRVMMITPDENYTGVRLREQIGNYHVWASIYDAMVRSGADILLVDGRDEAGGGRETFIRDKFFIIGDTAYIPDAEHIKYLNLPWHNEFVKDFEDYKNEIEQARQALSALGYKIVDVEGSWFEGGNVMLHESSRTLFFGIQNTGTVSSASRFWQNLESGRKLIAAVNDAQAGMPWNLEVVPLKISDFYHLDVGMSPVLPGGEVIIYPRMTTENAFQRIKNIIGEENLIEVEREWGRLGWQKPFLSNLDFNGNILVMSDTTPELEQILRDRGYQLITPEEYGLDTFEFEKAGAHCLTNELPPLDRPAEAPATNNTPPAPPPKM